MTTTIRGEKLYQNTCLQIPYDLKQAAKEQGINMTQILVHGIENKLKEQECSGMDLAPTSQPAAPSSTTRRSKEQ